ncbi:hypothetical protein AN641_04455 [Candidatus Epulonipiscioides gigas]|nr:hypothetical protein AN641_04455 [Epulopiscium sp. SCG-C07WGA-EpuloA2]
MPLYDKYIDYFNIDPEYFAVIDAAVIKNQPELWKKFYPHNSFLKLINDTISVLTRKQKLSLWTQGAYGTGKSHALLTLKNLLDAPENDVRAYFESFKIDNDLCNKFIGMKNSGDILTVHKYGSSAIRNDRELVYAIQKSISGALKERGIDCASSLKYAALKWLSNEHNKRYFNSLINSTYEELFNGDTVDIIIDKLNSYENESASLDILMKNILQVANEIGIIALSFDIDNLKNWIKDIISKYKFKAIVFIWDEFSEYFVNNMRSLTGFQQIVEISSTIPFYLFIITHIGLSEFTERDADYKKLLGRFLPIIQIELPDTMAFKLLGSAMKKKIDLQDEWELDCDALYDYTKNAREVIKNKTNIPDDDLKSVLPLHPYAALVLKNISSVFESNQRSMFDFIKNEQAEDIHGFLWFIKNFGPQDENPLLTVDMLWNYFYEKGKNNLAPDIRIILEAFNRPEILSLSKLEQRVIKTILLLQTIGYKTHNHVELFIPNEANLRYAFEGSDLDNKVISCAHKLVNDKILYNKPIGAGKTQFSLLINSGDMHAIEGFKKRLLEEKKTNLLINEGDLNESIILESALKLRYSLSFVSITNFDAEIKRIKNNTESSYKIPAIIAIAKDDDESVALSKKIREAVLNLNCDIVLVDATEKLGNSAFNIYCEYMAEAQYHKGKNNHDSDQHAKNAKEILTKWKDNISKGEFIIYTRDCIQGERIVGSENLSNKFSYINNRKFNKCLESKYTVIDNMYNSNSLKSGAKCGITQVTSGPFKSANNTNKLENALKEAWEVEEYWTKSPNILISQIKIKIDEFIKDEFAKSGRVTIKDIYELLKEAPYGFMPCNLSAFIVGFILKEYANGSFTFSDSITSSPLDSNKLSEMIEEIIKLQNTPNIRYKDKYIVALTNEEKAFLEGTSIVFHIAKENCSNMEQTREYIRTAMKSLKFPIWCLKYLNNFDSKLERLIDNYCGIANNQNVSAGKFSDNDIAMNIGKIYEQMDGLAIELGNIMTVENCKKGMIEYLKQYQNGELVKLAIDIDDNGQFINVVRSKLDANEATWLWNIETVNAKISEVILKYKIIFESNKIVTKTNSFESTVKEWCAKCETLRISFEIIKEYIGDIKEFLNILIEIIKSGTIKSSKRQLFYDLLVQYGEDFKDFYNNQFEIFKVSSAFYLKNLNESEIECIFKNMPARAFTKDKVDYINILTNIIEDFKIKNKNSYLKKLWQERTNTETPIIWSNKYKMPILCMVDDKEFENAQEAFETLNKNSTNTNDIEKAIEYLEQATFFKLLDNNYARDSKFKKYFLKNGLDIILTDINKVRHYLCNNINISAYYWMGMPEIDKNLQELAEASYNTNGYKKAVCKIDNMDNTKLKGYLKQLVKNNMIVGLQIIKED